MILLGELQVSSTIIISLGRGVISKHSELSIKSLSIRSYYNRGPVPTSPSGPLECGQLVKSPLSW